MKITIQGIETCGIIADLAKEFKRQGHDVLTIADRNKLYNYNYDYHLTSCLENTLVERNPYWKIPTRVSRTLFRRFYHILNNAYRTRLTIGRDLHIQVFSGWSGEEAQLRRIKASGAKIFTLFMGSDVRDYLKFQKDFQEEDWVFPTQYLSDPKEKIQRLRFHEEIADAIFSLPDQMGHASRSYYHLLVPIDASNITFHVPRRKRPLVVHAPTNRAIKGSDIIENSLGILQNEGIEFDYLPVTGIPHNSLLDILRVSDVLVDELILHGPGWLGFEAMASGCAVATRFFEKSPPTFRPPVCNINRQSITDRLRELLSNPQHIADLANMGREYVIQNNHVSKIVSNLVHLACTTCNHPDYALP
jgi:hypothetical protein